MSGLVPSCKRRTSCIFSSSQTRFMHIWSLFRVVMYASEFIALPFSRKSPVSCPRRQLPSFLSWRSHVMPLHALPFRFCLKVKISERKQSPYVSYRASNSAAISFIWTHALHWFRAAVTTPVGKMSILLNVISTLHTVSCQSQVRRPLWCSLSHVSPSIQLCFCP